MIKTPITLQNLRRKIYTKAKAEKTWRFREAENEKGSGGKDGVRTICIKN